MIDELVAAESITEDDLLFIDRLLAGWGAWASNEPGPNRPSEAGQVLCIAFTREGDYNVRLNDDDFTTLDAHIAVLAPRLRQIVELEYRSLWHGRRYLLTQEGKWRQIGLNYIAYGDRVAQAQKSLFKPVRGYLSDLIKTWRSRPK